MRHDAALFALLFVAGPKDPPYMRYAQAPGGGIGAPAQQSPQAPTAPGTAILRGHVSGADSGQPLRKAQVRIFAPEIRENRMATTDESGAYEFKDVRAGRYTISASKGSYVSISYGQQRPADASKPLEIGERQVVERVDLSLPRGAIVTGRILDEFGEPMSEVQVSAQRYQFMQGRRQLVPSGRAAATNDIGEFRLYGIPPGQYYLNATWRNPAGVNPNGNPGDRTAYLPTYAPGTTNVNEAQRITLQAAQQIDDVVMVLKPIKAARISGTATGTDGKPMSPAMIMVSETNTTGFNMTGTAQVRPDGTFTIVGLGPGTYSLRAQKMGAPSPDGPELAATTVTIAGDDVSDVALLASKPSNVSGRIIVDPAAAASLPSPLMLSLFPAQIVGIPAPPPPPARVGDDLTFESKAPPGMMRFMIGGGFNAPPAGWTIRSVRLSGVDVTDGIDFKPNEDVGGIEIELTNKVTTISGLVTNSRGEASKDYTTIAFAQEKEKWTGLTRYISSGRPDQDGRFKISGLPPGEYYIIAVDRIEPGQQNDPDFLESVRSRATSLSLNEGETKTVDLRLNSAG